MEDLMFDLSPCFKLCMRDYIYTLVTWAVDFLPSHNFINRVGLFLLQLAPNLREINLHLLNCTYPDHGFRPNGRS